jgi:DNA-binding transcriptional MerR regulator
MQSRTPITSTCQGLKVGPLARRTGLTVRTLHHYDDIGLLKPSERTRSGQRVYTPADIEQLQKILSLKQLGFSLEQIRELLTNNRAPLARVLSMHLTHVRANIEQQQRLCDKLEAICGALDASQPIGVDQFLSTIEEIAMIERHYTPEQLDALAKRRDALGPEGMVQAQQAWTDLIADARAQMALNAPPNSPEVLAVAQRWQTLVRAFTGGDPGITRSLNNLYTNEDPAVASRGAVDRALFDYIGQAIQHLGETTK